MKRVTIILILLLFAYQVWAQQSNRNQISSVPNTARYEIIQSELGARITLKIDKFLGNIYLLVEGMDGLSWQLLFVEPNLNDKKFGDKVNYQIFTSGLGQRFTFLLNIHTGATWQLTEDKRSDELFWSVFD